MKTKTVLSLGGSLIVPGAIATPYLKKFHDLILSYIKKRQFFMVTGGGYTARHYQDAVRHVAQLTREDLDWLGIHATRLNGHLVRTLFRAIAHPRVLHHPGRHEAVSESVVIAGGERPGNSTDYVAVKLAKTYKAAEVINLSDVDCLYTKDPKKYKDAKPIYNITWAAFRKIVGNKWDPGLHLPFDPIASELAEKAKMRVVILNGRNLRNLKNYLDGKSFKGTVIE